MSKQPKQRHPAILIGSRGKVYCDEHDHVHRVDGPAVDLTRSIGWSPWKVRWLQHGVPVASPPFDSRAHSFARKEQQFWSEVRELPFTVHDLLP